MFEDSIRRVRRSFARIGLGYVFDGVRRISVVRQESYHDVRTRCIGLNPRDVIRPYAAVHRRPYLLIHELGHAFAEIWLTRSERRRLAPVFGDYDAPYRRLPKPARADRDHVSRYAMTHPAEDFAETFAVCLWRDWDRAAVARLLHGKGRRLRDKMDTMGRLIRSKSGQGRPGQHRSARISSSGAVDGPLDPGDVSLARPMARRIPSTAPRGAHEGDD
jgi:hypothetical protein